MAAIQYGDLLVYRVGDGMTMLSGSATAVFVDEYTVAGSLVQSIALPTSTSGTNRKLTASGTATSEGQLTWSTAANALFLTGYDAALGLASVSTSNSMAVSRVVGKIDIGGIVDTSTTVTAFSGTNIRGAASDGVNVWAVGGADGVQHAVLGGSGSTLVSNTIANNRAVNIFDDQLYYSTGSGVTPFIGTVGMGLPTLAGQVMSPLPGATSMLTPEAFYLADLSAMVAGLDTLYAVEAGGISKWSLVGGSWASNGRVTFSGTGLGLAASAHNGIVDLYASTATSILSLSDMSGYNGAFSAMPTVIATAGPNTAFRGLALALANQPPIAVADGSMLNQRTSASGNVLANDSDPDGDALAVSAITNDFFTQPIPPGGSFEMLGLFGRLTINSFGGWLYTADKEGGVAVGETRIDHFSYTVTDSRGASSMAQVDQAVAGSPTGDAGPNTFILINTGFAIDGEGGQDTAVFTDAIANVVVTLNGSVVVPVTSGGAPVAITLRNVENLTGGYGADAFTGDGLANTLNGLGGTDTLQGAGADDVLIGGPASAGQYNLLDGGPGADAASYLGTLSSVYADLRTGAGFVDGVLTDLMTSVENLTGGSGDDTLVGDDGPNVLAGGGGQDLLFGLGGADTFIGGTSPFGTQNQIFGGEGADTVDYSAQTAPVYVELRAPAGYVNGGLIDFMNSIENAIGGSSGDVLVGEDGVANTLEGREGTDLLFGFSGDDILIGGGAVVGEYNQLFGGDGFDTASYAGTTANVYADLQIYAGYLELMGLVLTDVWNSVENLTGGAGADVLAGDAGANRITGAGGADILYGRGGADAVVYRSASESSISGGYDTIADFETAIDQLDFAALGISAGQVLISSSGGSTALYADVDPGTAGYELAIAFVGANAVAMSDIIF